MTETKREILFRGKKMSDGKWVYGDYHKFTCTTSSAIPTTTHYIMGTGASSKVQIWVDPATVGQYTGKDDVRRQKIFDGDILEIRYGTEKYNGLVKYDTYGAKFIIVSDCGTSSFDDLLWDVKIQVIGNIYDNQELLGGNNGTVD